MAILPCWIQSFEQEECCVSNAGVLASYLYLVLWELAVRLLQGAGGRGIRLSRRMCACVMCLGCVAWGFARVRRNSSWTFSQLWCPLLSTCSTPQWPANRENGEKLLVWLQQMSSSFLQHTMTSVYLCNGLADVALPHPSCSQPAQEVQAQ